MLKEKCQMTDSEWEERQKTRQLEREAVSKALAVLSGDDAHDLFTRTFNPALLQEESSMHSARRLLAAKLLSEISDRAILGWHQSDIQRPKSYSWGACDEPEGAFGLPLMDGSNCSHSIAALALLGSETLLIWLQGTWLQWIGGCLGIPHMLLFQRTADDDG